ncbi:MAG: ABC transporter permease [Vicinamibacterales bacterium]
MAARSARSLSHALRALARAPFFTATAVLSLGIGIGANTTIFTAANALLIAPPSGVAAADRLVDIGRTTRGGGFDTVGYPTFADLRDATAGVFTGVYAVRVEPQPMSLGAAGGARRIYAQMVSASFFDVLGVPPAAGTFFRTDEERVGVPLRKVVLSHASWRRDFGGDPAVVGREIVLNGDSFVVAGITPEGFTGTTILSPDLWVPLTAYARATPSEGLITGRANSWLTMSARLAPGVSVDQADQAVRAFAARLLEAYPDVYRDRGLTVMPTSRVPGEAGAFAVPFVGMLMGLVGLVLLVACANLAGLLLARTTGRAREIAVRLALGATRGSVVRLVLTETLLLFGIGALAAIVFAAWTTGAMAGLLTTLPFPIALDFAMDWRVIAFTAGLTLATGLVTGLVPALQATRTSLTPDLKQDAGAPRRRRLRHAFVTAQVAACVVLVTLAGLFLHALGRAGTVDTGMVVDGVDVAAVNLELGGLPSEQWAEAAEDLRARLRTLPGVTEVGAGRVVPLQGSSMGLGDVRRRGDTTDEGRIDADWNVITPGYLQAIGVPVVRGRAFDERDRADAPMSAIVSAHLAERTWPGQDPIGQMVEFGDFRPGHEDVRTMTVVGVTRDAKYRSIGEAPTGFIFVPLAQYPMEETHFFIRRGDTPVGERLVRDVLRAYDPNLPLVDYSPFRQQADLGLLPQRIASTTAGALGAVALVLAAIGIYGIMAFAVASRTREMGLRAALGADPARLRRLVLLQGLRLTGAGVGVGLLAALGVAQLVRSLLFGVSPADPVSFGLTAVGVLALGVAAGIQPARRAARVDPVVALRAE